MSRAQVQELRAAFRATRFWANADENADEPEVVVADGSQWIVEAVAGGRYRVKDRSFGKPDLRELGMTFLRLAGLEDEKPCY